MKLTEFPQLVKEWHPTKNGDLTPEDCTHGSKKKVWWKCSKGHSYEAMPNSRTASKSGCPYCSGYKIGTDNNLESLYPEIAKEWHPTKNSELTPKDVAPATNKKFWWLCPRGHSYYSVVSNRTNNNAACPYCSGNKVGDDNNLEFVYPEIAKEWHPIKNGKLTPRDITPNSTKKVWWLCSSGHSYDAKSNVRVSMKTNCPYCSGRRVSDDNNLLAVFPEVAKDWHPTKNEGLTSKGVTSKSDKKVWWLCAKGHTYQAIIKNRTLGGNGCPFCSNQSSEPEIRILSELKWVFNEINSRHKIDGVEIDIFIPRYNIGVEYDGKYWHKEKEVKDKKKNQFVSSKGVNLIRVREKPLQSLSDSDILVDSTLDKSDLNKIVKKIYPLVNKEAQEKMGEYLTQKSFVNEELFKEYRSYFPSPFPEKSLLVTHSVLSEEWDYDKNHPLRPENFTYGSGRNIWWLCSKGHSYERQISTRTNHGTGCPYCSGKKSLTKDLFE